MGCGASKAATDGASLSAKETASSAGQGSPPGKQAQASPDFPLTTPMLVMPYPTFKEQKRICKSTKAWREKAMKAGRLVTFNAETHIAIFISHTWCVLRELCWLRVVPEKNHMAISLAGSCRWDRAFVDESNDPNNPYDKGAPDWQSGEKKDLKWRVICAGVEALAEQKEWPLEKVVLWLDWQSIYQDDEAEKGKGVASLIKYATMCKAMLVPTEEAVVEARWPEKLPAYGTRGWVRAPTLYARTRLRMLIRACLWALLSAPHARSVAPSTSPLRCGRRWRGAMGRWSCTRPRRTGG